MGYAERTNRVRMRMNLVIDANPNFEIDGECELKPLTLWQRILRKFGLC